MKAASARENDRLQAQAQMMQSNLQASNNLQNNYDLQMQKLIARDFDLNAFNYGQMAQSVQLATLPADPVPTAAELQAQAQASRSAQFAQIKAAPAPENA